MDNEMNLETQETSEGSRTYTQEEVDALLQSETDRRVTSALKKAEEKNKAKAKEAEKLAQMNAEQKYEYELEQREKAIVEKEKALTMAENKNEASKILAEKGISLQLVDFVVAEDAETMNNNISLLDKAFKESVKAEVEKRMGSKAPEKAGIDTTGMTKEQWNNLSLAEQMQIKAAQPELYAALTGRKE